MNPHTVQSNTTNRNLQAQTAPAEPAVAENPLPLLDVQPVEVPQAIEIRAELAAVEDLAGHQSIEAREEGVGKGKCLSAEKTFLENLLSLAPELQGKILGRMHMQSLGDLDPLLEAILQEVQELRALEDAQRPAEKISSLRQLAQLALENGNSTPQLSASIAALLQTIDQEVELLQASGGEEGPASKIAKLRALAHLAVENVCIDRLDLSNHETYVQFMECSEKLHSITGNPLDAFQFKLIKEIIIDPNQIDLLPKFFKSSRSVTIHAQGIVVVSSYCIRVLGQLSKLTTLQLKDCQQLTDIGGLGQLNQLTQLFLRDCHQLVDISPLTQLSNLTHLWLINCQQLTDISALGQLSNLTELWLNGCHQLSDITTVGQLKNLRKLSVGGYQQLNALGALGQLSHLTHLILDGCAQLTAIGPLEQFSHLTHLWLINCQQLTDIRSLGQLNPLTKLRLEACHQLTSIDVLGQLSHLTHLSLDGCQQLSDVSALGQLSNLTVLVLLNSQQLTDLSPLANLKGLTTLYLRGCQGITDISPLRDLSHLQLLDVTGCPLDEASRELLEDLRNKNNRNVDVKFE